MRQCVMLLTVLLVAGCQSPNGGGGYAPTAAKLNKVRLWTPRDPDEVKYLGISADSPAFGLMHVRAEVLVIWVFDVHCPPCRGIASSVGDLYRLVGERGYVDRIKFIGVAALTSNAELLEWRKGGVRAFPMFSDPDAETAEALGGYRYPYFLVIGLEGADAPKVLIAQQTDTLTPREFLDRIVDKAGLR